MHSNQSQETIETRYFPRGNHKGENPVTSSEIESSPMLVAKHENIKMISTAYVSLSHTERASPLSFMRPNE